MAITDAPPRRGQNTAVQMAAAMGGADENAVHTRAITAEDRAGYCVGGVLSLLAIGRPASGYRSGHARPASSRRIAARVPSISKQSR